MRDRTLRLGLILSLGYLLGGCVVAHGGPHAPPLASKSSAMTRAPAKGCPPGHQWSDGRCHERGKGHGKDKHER